MPNFASINLIGHIGREPELKRFQDGTAILKFSLAVNTGFKDKKICSWYECAMFGKRAESVIQFLAKGKPIMIQGEPVIREWEKDGRKGKTAEVRVNELTLLGGRDEAQDSASSAQHGASEAQPDQGSFDNGVPF